MTRKCTKYTRGRTLTEENVQAKQRRCLKMAIFGVLVYGSILGVIILLVFYVQRPGDDSMRMDLQNFSGLFICGGSMLNMKNEEINCELFHPSNMSENSLWTPPLSSGRRFAAMGVVSDYIVQVRSVDYQNVNSTLIIDANLETSFFGPNLLSQRFKPASTVFNNSFLLICGGDPNNTCEVLDSSLSDWSKLRKAPPHAASEASLVSLDSYIYLIGGFDGSHALDSLERLDPFSEIWRPLQSMPGPRRNFGAAVWQKTIVICGGYNDNFEVLSSCARYWPKKDIWLQMAPLNTARFGLKLIDFNGVLLALGGGKKIEKFEKKWTSVKEELLLPRRDFGVVKI